MRRRLSSDAEVFGRLDQSRAKMVLPDPVDDDAGRQGVLGRSQPLGQAEAIVGSARGQGR